MNDIRTSTTASAPSSIFSNPESLVDQFSRDAFLEAFGRTTFLFERMHPIDAEAFSDFVYDLLSATKYSASNVRLAMGGNVTAAPRTTVRGRAYADLSRLLEGLQDGQTFNMNGVERLRADLRVISSALESIFETPVQANLYISYEGSTTGFSAHRDMHDVVVVQLAGTKRWTVYDPPPAGATLERGRPNQTELRQPQHDYVLTSGCSLYVPAGFAHEVATLDGVSAHLTYGIGCIRWVDVIAEVVQRSDETELLKRVPMSESEILSDYEARIAAIVAGLFSRISIVDATERCREFGKMNRFAKTIRRALMRARTSDER